MKKTGYKWTGMGALLCTLGGCINLEPQAVDLQYYQLGAAMAEPVVAIGSDLQWLQLRLAPLPMLADSAVLTVIEGSTVLRDPRDRWAEPLRDGIARQLQNGIWAQGGEWILAETLPQVAAPVLRLEVHTLEATADGRLRLEASWVIERDTAAGAPQWVRLEGSWEPSRKATLAEGWATLFRTLGAEVAKGL